MTVAGTSRKRVKKFVKYIVIYEDQRRDSLVWKICYGWTATYIYTVVYTVAEIIEQGLNGKIPL